jgi:hypothetical protein
MLEALAAAANPAHVGSFRHVGGVGGSVWPLY